MTEPTPTSRLDADLRTTVARYHRLRWWLVSAVAVILVLTAIVGGIVIDRQSSIVSHQQSQLTASCGLYHDLGQLELHPTPPLHKVGSISVVIITDARRAFIGQCSGQLDPPTKSLVFWAGYYHLPIPAPSGRP